MESHFPEIKEVFKERMIFEGSEWQFPYPY